jgi:hypothetical protein
VDIESVSAAVVASLDRPIRRVSKRHNERLVTGWRGTRKLDFGCEYGRSGSSGFVSQWYVAAEVEGCPPLLVHLNRRGRTDAEAAGRGDIVVVRTGDAAFDEGWTVEGAPQKTVAMVFTSSVREAVARLSETGVKLKAFDAVDSNGVVYISAGTVKVSSSGPFDADVVLRGIELAVVVCEAISVIVDARRQSPPAPAQIAAEEADVGGALRSDPGSMEGRLWRRMSTKTRVLVVIGALVLGIYALVDLARQALSFLH